MTELIKKEKLLFGLPIETEFGTLYPPTLEDFLIRDFEYSIFLRAFSINASMLLDNAEGIKNFDIFLFQVAQNVSEKDLLINDLIESLKILFRTDNVTIKSSAESLDSIGILINDDVLINRNNYDKLSEIVLIMQGDGNNVLEENQRKELDELDLKFEMKRREFEKRKRKRDESLGKKENQITIYDLANYIIHTDNSQYTYDSVIKLTIYQIKNTFKLYNQKENYNLYMDYKTGGFEIKDQIKHWYFNN